jgi:hypothetical protein
MITSGKLKLKAVTQTRPPARTEWRQRMQVLHISHQ